MQFIFVFISQPGVLSQGSDCNYSCIKLSLYYLKFPVFSPTYFSILTFHYKVCSTLFSEYILPCILYFSTNDFILSSTWSPSHIPSIFPGLRLDPSFKVQFQHHLFPKTVIDLQQFFQSVPSLYTQRSTLKALVSFSSSSSLCSSFTDIDLLTRKRCHCSIYIALFTGGDLDVWIDGWMGS